MSFKFFKGNRLRIYHGQEGQHKQLFKNVAPGGIKLKIFLYQLLNWFRHAPALYIIINSSWNFWNREFVLIQLINCKRRLFLEIKWFYGGFNYHDPLSFFYFPLKSALLLGLFLQIYSQRKGGFVIVLFIQCIVHSRLCRDKGQRDCYLTGIWAWEKKHLIWSRPDWPVTMEL